MTAANVDNSIRSRRQKCQIILHLSLLLLQLLATRITPAAGEFSDNFDGVIPLRTNFPKYTMSGKYIYLGCYDLGPYFAELPHILLEAPMSSARCYMYCLDGGYLFFGTRADKCHCGDTYGLVGGKPESACNRACELDASEKCGGERALSVYAVVERFQPMGCFSAHYGNSSHWKFAGEQVSKMECSLMCQKEFAPYFGMQVGHICHCIHNIDKFVPQTDLHCLGNCLERDTVNCGLDEFTSVYMIEYAIAMEKVLGSRIGFLGGNRQLLLTIKSVSLVGVAVEPSSRLYFKAHYEDRKGSNNFSQSAGETTGVHPTPCPSGWLSHYLLNADQTESGRRLVPGYRCYLPASNALTWTEALRQCWQQDSDLFYLEDDSEFKYLSRANLGLTKYWIGMFFNATLNQFAWVRDGATAGLSDPGGHRRALNSAPTIQPTGKGCIRLTPQNEIYERDFCSDRMRFLCKRFSSLFSNWDEQLSSAIPHDGKVQLKLHKTGGTLASLLQVTLNMTVGNHTSPIPSFPGSRLHYSVIERVPLKICHQGPPNGPPQFYTCSQPGNEPSRWQFGKLTCANENRLRLRDKWTQPLTDWLEDVSYFVTEVHYYNRHNLTRVTLSTSRGMQCRVVDSGPKLGKDWIRFACNADLRWLFLASNDTRYHFVYMCDLLVYGYLTSDNYMQTLTGQFKPEDRILDLNILGIFSGNPDGTRYFETNPMFEDLYLRIYNRDELLNIVHHRHSTHFSTAIRLNESSRDLILFNSVRDHRTGDQSPATTCSVEIRVGNLTCQFANSQFLAMEIKERANLIDCSQSSSQSAVDYCENAFNTAHGETHRLGRCAQTSVSNRPWWRAKVYATFLFRQIVLYALASRNEWTRNFDLSVESASCVNVRYGAGFVKGDFACGLAGTEIKVQALADRVSLAICEILAFGRPGGCGIYRSTNGPCQGRLFSHLGFGKIPYEKSLRCVWTIGGAPDQTALVTFPKFRTAGPGDRVTVYEGVGTGGRPIARFFGLGDSKPKLPAVTIHGVTNYVVGRLAFLTLEFVTDGGSSGSRENRSLLTHLGFAAEFLLTHNDHLYDQQSGLNGLCDTTVFFNLVNGYCMSRGTVHPVYTHGDVIGAAIYEQMKQNLLRQQSRDRLRNYSRLTRLEKRDIPSESLRAYYCSSEEATAELPPYLRDCCCRSCSVKFLIGLCLQHYATLLDDSCSMNVTRIK